MNTGQPTPAQLERAVEVKGLTVDDVEKDDLQMIFESSRFGEAEVDDIFMTDDGRVIVVFKTPSDAKRLVQLSEAQRLRVMGMDISIHACSLPAAEADAVERNVLVTGTAGLDEDDLKLIFENKRKGGGTIQKIDIQDEDSVKVTFEDDSVADHWVQVGECRLGRNNLKISWCRSAPQQETDSSDSVVFLNVPKALVNYFSLMIESERYGGEVVEINHREDQSVLVQFKDFKVAQKFRSQGSITVNGTVIKVAKPEVKARKKPIRQPSNNNIPQMIEHTTVEVSGISAHINEDYLRFYFENERRSGGGEIEDLQFNPTDGTASITFKRPEAVQRILSRTPHKLNDMVLEVTLLESLTDDLRDQECAILVTGLNKDTSEDMLDLYFGNEKKSGGGEVENIYMNADLMSAVVTFTNPKVAERVAGRTTHTCCNIPFSVVRLRAAPPPPVVLQDVDPLRLLFRDLPIGIDQQDLKSFVEPAAGDCAVKHMTFGKFFDVAVVDFSREPDYKAVRKLVVSKPLKGKMITVQKVQRTSCIQVLGTGSLGQDMISLYFDNTARSGGGEIKQLQMREKEDLAIVEFVNQQVVDEVLKRKHVIGQLAVTVKLYYPYLDNAKAKFTVPDNVDILVDKQKKKFICKCDAFRMKVENDLSAHHCSVKWPTSADNDDYVVLQCTLTVETVESRVQILQWADECRNILDEHLSTIVDGVESVSSEIWQAYVDKLTSTASKALDAMYTEQDDQGFTFLYVGTEDVVRSFRASASRVKSRLMEELAKAKSKTYETIPNIPAAKLQIIQRSRFMTSLPPDVEVSIDRQGQSVCLQGTPKQIVQAKLLLYQNILNNVQHHKAPLDSFKVKLLQRESCDKHFKEIFERKGWNVAWSLEKDEFTVYAEGDVRLSEVISTISDSLIKKTLSVNSADSTGLALPGWKTLEQSFATKYECLDVVVASDKSIVTFYGLKNDVESAYVEVDTFLAFNKVLEQFIDLPEGKVSYFERFMAAEVSNMMDDIPLGAVSLIHVKDEDNSGLIVRGAQMYVNDATHRIRSLVDGIVDVAHISDTPGLRKYCETRDGKNMIAKIEDDKKVIVTVSADSPRDDEVSDDVSRNVAARQSTAVDDGIRCKFKLSSGASVAVAQKKITDCRGDVVVLFVDDSLNCSVGAAKELSDAGGQQVADSLRRSISRRGKLLPGNASITDGRLLSNFTHVVFGVTNRWQQNSQHAVDSLYEAVYAALQSAVNENASNVIIAGIPTGYEAKAACPVLCEAVAVFLTSFPEPIELTLIDTNSSTVKSLIDSVDKTFSDKSQRLSQTASATSSAAADASSVQPRISTFMKTSTPNTMVTSRGLTVSLVKGAIAEQKADVIVNTISPDVVLTQGAVSDSILQAAGTEIQAECTKNAPSGAKFGDVIETAGYKLNCQRVFHCVCPKWDRTKQAEVEQQMRTLIKTCLDKANHHRLTSIAFPAIGTGNLGVPHDVVCKIMYSEVEQCSINESTYTVKDVRFVLLPRDYLLIQAFEDHMGLLLGTKSRGSSTGKVSRELKKSQSSFSSFINTMPSLSKKMSAKTPDSKTSADFDWKTQKLLIGNVFMQIGKGDITDESTDAIVNSTNDKLLLTGGAVASAIREKGGKSIEDECLAIGKMTDGIAVTNAGKLLCKRIIHLSVLPSFGKKAPTTKEWEDGVTKCLKKAESLKLKSIAFPLLGTGKWTTPASDMAESILNAVVNFCFNEKPKSVTLVRIVIFQEQMVTDFTQAVIKKLEEKKSTWEKLKDKFGKKSTITVVDNDVGMTAEQPEPMITVIRVFGRDKDVMDRAIEDIESSMSCKLSTKIMDNENDQAMIRKLTEHQIMRMKLAAAERDVQIDVERKQRINRIVLCGMAADIPEVMCRIYEIFREVDLEERECAQMKLLAKQVHWEFQIPNGSYEPYPDSINAIIEKAHENSLPTAEWEEHDDVVYMIDFSRMVELRKDGQQSPVSVKRVNEMFIPEPSTWEPMPSGKLVHMSDVPINSKEFEEIDKRIRQTSRDTIKEILKVQRIQNPVLFKQYAVKKMHMETVNGKNFQNERILFHGTAADTVDQINNSGFNRSYCGKNATAYGKGTYFANMWWYSAQDLYSPKDSKGYKYVYQCRVLTGAHLAVPSGGASESLVDAPLKPGSSTARYDSVADHQQTPGIFVIFRDASAYPEYLITFI